jgi:opacity protein-like surface antigen
MKKTLLLLAIIAGSASAADVYTQGYQRNNGTYVQPHYQTAPDNTNLNNYSTQGNTNPYTGQQGHVQPNPYPNYQPQQRQNQGQSGYCPYGQRC